MTTEKNGPPRVCKDCYPTREDRQAALFMGGSVVNGKMVRRRPAPHAGPRCVTHHREVVKARKAANHEKRVQETYGLLSGEYAQLYQYQQGRCALCRRATGASKKLAVDHDHASGEVRGLACGPCNRILGHARDNPEYFGRAIAYLKIPPYARMKEGWEWDE